MIAKPKNDYAPAEMMLPDAVPEDDRLWVQTGENVWFRPLLLCVSQGYWMNVVRIARSGVIARHTHTQPVHGFVIKGSWRYLEHDWVARENSYVYEPPGDTHTLYIDEGAGEMITMFQIHGCLVLLDENGAVTGFEDVFSRVEQCRAHFEAVGLGASYVERFLR